MLIDVDFYVDVDQHRCTIPKSPRNRERPDLTLLLSCTCHVVITYMGVSEKLGCRNGRVRVFSKATISLNYWLYSNYKYRFTTKKRQQIKAQKNTKCEMWNCAFSSQLPFSIRYRSGPYLFIPIVVVRANAMQHVKRFSLQFPAHPAITL